MGLGGGERQDGAGEGRGGAEDGGELDGIEATELRASMMSLPGRRVVRPAQTNSLWWCGRRQESTERQCKDTSKASVIIVAPEESTLGVEGTT